MVYSWLLLQANTNRELSSGLHFTLFDELFPDWSKAAERTRDGEISPNLKECLEVHLQCLWLKRKSETERALSTPIAFH